MRPQYQQRPPMRPSFVRAPQEPVITEEVTGIVDIFGTDGRAMARAEYRPGGKRCIYYFSDG